MHFCAEKIIFPESLSQRICQALWRGIPKDLEKEGLQLRELWPLLAKHKGIAEKSDHYSFQREKARAYSAYYLTVNALKAPLILEEAQSLGINLFSQNETTWLDMGSGPGTVGWGLSWWQELRKKKIKYIAWDQSPQLLDAAKALRNHGQAQFEVCDLEEPNSWNRNFLSVAPDIVSLSNSLTEIASTLEQKKSYLQNIFHKLQKLTARDGKNRFLLVIEPGTRENSRELSQLKDYLVADHGLNVLLPCLDNRTCGALVRPTDWCHEEVACEFPEWLNEMGEHAGMRKESILFSYLLASVKPIELPCAGGNRVVSQRLERKGQVECYFCTKSGKAMARVQRSKVTHETESFFEVSRGDIFMDLKLGEKGDVEKILAPIGEGSKAFEVDSPP